MRNPQNINIGALLLLLALLLPTSSLRAEAPGEVQRLDLFEVRLDEAAELQSAEASLTATALYLQDPVAISTPVAVDPELERWMLQQLEQATMTPEGDAPRREGE